MRILISYAYAKDNPEWLAAWHAAGVKLVLDSGAFTALTLGTSIDLDEYARFVREVSPYIEGAFNLDVIGNEKASADNFRMLQQKAPQAQLIPVWQGTDLSLEGFDAFAEGQSYIALGGLVSSMTPGAAGMRGSKRWLLEICRRFTIAAKGRRTHLLGISRGEVLKYASPYSTDSSSWLSFGRFRAAVRFSHGGKLRIIDTKNPKRQDILDFKTATGYSGPLIQRRGNEVTSVETEFGLLNLANYIGALGEITMQKSWEKYGVIYYLAAGEMLAPKTALFQNIMKNYKDIHG